MNSIRQKTSWWKSTIPCIIGVAGSWKLSCQGSAASVISLLIQAVKNMKNIKIGYTNNQKRRTRAELNRRFRVLQTHALPLCYLSGWKVGIEPTSLESQSNAKNHLSYFHPLNLKKFTLNQGLLFVTHRQNPRLADKEKPLCYKNQNYHCDTEWGLMENKK